MPTAFILFARFFVALTLRLKQTVLFFVLKSSAGTAENLHLTGKKSFLKL